MGAGILFLGFGVPASNGGGRRVEAGPTLGVGWCLASRKEGARWRIDFVSLTTFLRAVVVLNARRPR